VKTYYTIYKITHIPSGKFYIGRHQTKNLDDEYMGSGAYLKRAQEKYGLDQFRKEYLHIFDSDQPMYEMEQELVTEEFCKRSDTYNVQSGGFDGGWQWVNIIGAGHTPEAREKAAKKNRGSDGVKYGAFLTNTNFRGSGKRGLEIARKNYPEGTFKNKTHTDQTKSLMSKKAKERLKDPTKNSQYGTMWITDGSESRKIHKNELIPEGWYKGRKMKTTT